MVSSLLIVMTCEVIGVTASNHNDGDYCILSLKVNVFLTSLIRHGPQKQKNIYIKRGGVSKCELSKGKLSTAYRQRRIHQTHMLRGYDTPQYL